VALGKPRQRVRVALRRLRVWLSFKGHRALQEELRWLCSALALLRDLDVFGEVFTAEALAELRPGAVAMAVAALESQRWEVLREALGAVRPPKASRATRAVKRLGRKLADQREKLVADDGEALHRLRRSLRRLRYGQEWLGQNTSELGQEQERLGAVCDLLALQSFAHRQGVEAPAQLSEAIAKAFDLLGEER
jgi:CHAD domain-containing protein